MTWKEFKEEVETKGVTDEMEIWFIDISFPEVGDVGVSPQEAEGPSRIGLSIT